MIRRRPKVMVNAFRRLFGAAAHPAEPNAAADARATSAEPLRLLRLPGAAGLPLTWRRNDAVRGPIGLSSEEGAFAVVTPKGQRRFEGRTASGAWRIEAGWSGSVNVRRDGEGEPLVAFATGVWGDGKVTRSSGETLKLRVEHRSQSCTLETDDGRVLIELESSGVVRRTLTMRLHEAARSMPDLEALLMLMAIVADDRSRKAFITS